MKKELELELVKKYPKLFQEYNKPPQQSCMAFGCECGNGWYNILNELFEALSKYDDIILAQVKEKFGGLRVYIHGAPVDVSKEVHKLIDNAEEKSFTVCEMCGKEGTLRGDGWMVTLCESCNEKRENGK